MKIRGDEQNFLRLDFLKKPKIWKNFETIPEFLSDICGYGDIPALCFGEDFSVTYSELYSDICGMCGYFEKIKLPRSCNVGLCAENGYYFIVISLALMAYGCCAVLIPPSFKGNVPQDLIKKFDLKLIFVKEEDIQSADTVYAGNPILYRSTFSSNAINSDINPESPACIFFTGGTTGQSKGAILSHRALLRGTANWQYNMFSLEHEDSFLALPLTHVFGYIRNFLVNMLLGNTVHFSTGIRNYFKDMMRVHPNETVMVPKMADLLLDTIERNGIGVTGGKLTTVVSGAAHVPEYLIRGLDKYGIHVYPGYGMTETANLTTGNPIPLQKIGSVGPLYPYQEAQIVDGELLLKGKNLFSGYYADTELNIDSFSDGWFKTGDLAHFDTDGFLYITGRIKSLIALPTGEKISPDELEMRVSEIDAVRDALLYLKEDEGTAGRLRLEVTLRPEVVEKLNIDRRNAEKLVTELIREKVSEMPNCFHSAKIVIRERDFDRTPSMKIKRP